jgi:MYXO-CTERM domain-containing protein
VLYPRANHLAWPKSLPLSGCASDTTLPLICPVEPRLRSRLARWPQRRFSFILDGSSVRTQSRRSNNESNTLCNRNCGTRQHDALAQTANQQNSPAPNGAAGSDNAPVTESRSPDTPRDGRNFSWIGLLGLIGLAGLRGRRSHESRESVSRRVAA